MQIETNWQPGGAQGATCEASRMLVAVRVRNRTAGWEYWDFGVCTVTDDGSLDLGDVSWGWDWSDVDWFVDLDRQALPVPPTMEMATRRETSPPVETVAVNSPEP